MSEIKARPLQDLKSWSLQDAKSRFSEVVRQVQDGEPLRVTVRGEDAVVVIAASAYARLVPPRDTTPLYDLVMQTPPMDMDEFDEILESFRVPGTTRPLADLSE